MVKLYIRDNSTGTVHEYGDNPHDALILQPDGSLHYLNMQNLEGTGKAGGYTFCLADGNIPDASFYPDDAYIDIGGCQPDGEQRKREAHYETLKRVLLKKEKEGDSWERDEYRKYQLRWMAEHGHSLQDLIRELEELRVEDEHGVDMPLNLLFEQWEMDRGFGGELWACFQEFVSSELYE